MLSLSLWKPKPLEIHWCCFLCFECVQPIQKILDFKPQTAALLCLLGFFSISSRHYKHRERIIKAVSQKYLIWRALDIWIEVVHPSITQTHFYNLVLFYFFETPKILGRMSELLFLLQVKVDGGLYRLMMMLC